jgi:F-type H+-transporting ATPase subunit delta
VPKGASARRYAQAVFEIARDADDFDRWTEGLEALRQLATQPEMVVYLQSPQVSIESKRAVLEQILGTTHPLRLNFALLLASRSLLTEVDGIAAEFHRLENEYLGIAVAYVTSAVPLEQAEATAVSEHLASITGKRITLDRAVEPEIVGGIVARVGDRLIDGSVASQLAALRKQMVE